MEVPTFSFGSVFEEAHRRHTGGDAGAAVPGSPVDLFSIDVGSLGTPSADCPLSFEALFSATTTAAKVQDAISSLQQQPQQQPHAAAQHSPVVPTNIAAAVPQMSPPQSVPSSSSVGSSPASSPTFSSGPGVPGLAAAVAQAAQVQQQQQQLQAHQDILPAYTGPLPSSFHDLTEVQIATISFKNFTKLMAKSKLTERQISEAKKLRRRVKNRVSARLCSTRKRVKVVTTETSNTLLGQRVQTLATQNENLLNQHMMLQERCIELQKNEAQLTREKLYAEAECARLRALLKQATDAGLTAGQGQPVNGGLYAHAA